MRTTVTLEDDLAGLLEQQAEARGVSFEEVLNSTLRFGLTAQARAQEMAAESAPRVRTRPFAALGLKPGVDRDKMNQLCDELETEAFQETNRDWLQES